MPLVKATLQAELASILSNTDNTAQQAAEKIATAIDTYIKSATVTVTGTRPAGPSPAPESSANKMRLWTREKSPCGLIFGYERLGFESDAERFFRLGF